MEIAQQDWHPEVLRLFRERGRKGGLANSRKQRAARRKNIKKALAVRWREQE